MSQTISQQIAGEPDGHVGRVIDLSMPWAGQESPWQRAEREAGEKSEWLAAAAERLLAQADAASALRGIGYAVLALRAELEWQHLRRDR